MSWLLFALVEESRWVQLSPGLWQQVEPLPILSWAAAMGKSETSLI